ncbi:endonuclease/exonuclease/phosphatase family protein [Herbiconiux daphne]|uniref:Endonuclease/exonuclease/phosphatase family protein n=1 Tax=Herbiconiux daphne TaxID=2970914 RepID=A0ABT2H0Q9_9MICO|nr:endonuclease/exonuclease/phosphatase family protein [Herbiconiux daphne]MCS5733506.1 endonuclease/exonuclease/phosphatase family protein [Herbiconiux daphne]
MPVSALIGQVDAPDLQIATFNIRRRMPPTLPRTADQWSARTPAIAAFLSTERPHVLGTQEVLPGQDRFIRAALGEDYRRVGHGRDADGQGEGCPLYYDGTRLELLSWHQSALSDTPESPGSHSWGNMTPRVLVGAVLRDRVTEARFLAINTHFDNVSRRSRVLSARTIRQLVAEQSLPAVMTGDLNSGEGTAPLVELFADGTLTDAWSIARDRLTPEWGTFPDYAAPRLGRKRIDWVAVTPDIEVRRAAIDTRRPGGVWASDHLPVQAVVRLPSAEPSVAPHDV